MHMFSFHLQPQANALKNETGIVGSPHKNLIATPAKIGFLGLGIMGRAMVENLLKSGHEVTVWNRTTAKVRRLLFYWGSVSIDVNSLAPGKCSCNLKLVISKPVSRIDILSISGEIALKWLPQDLTDTKSGLVFT